jgi:hypothetical protein
VTNILRRRLAATAIVAGLVCAGAPALATPAFAAQPTWTRSTVAESPLDYLNRATEVRYAENHWNWTAWDDSTAVAPGADQPNYECAEFVARALAAAGLIPGLSPDAPQNDYFDYTAPNDKVYDLLLISDLPQYHNIYDYLMDSGIGKDVGEDLAFALPGDVVVTYAGPGETMSHTGLVVQAATVSAEATVDAHNHARFHYGYHYYAPSHLVRLVPNAALLMSAWAAVQKMQNMPQLNPFAPHQFIQLPGMASQAGPQV